MSADATTTPENAAARFAVLPEPVRLEDTVTTQETEPAPDPAMGIDPNHEWMIRHG